LSDAAIKGNRIVGKSHSVNVRQLFLPRHFCYFYGMEAEATPAKISIDDFRKIALKVATITAAEAHPNADKLMVLQIDLGGEQRQICAGIRNSYAAEELVGKQIIVVTNLETAKLRGLESQGMLLAASDEGRVIIMTPEKSVQAGAQVK
jgi:methionine--tRNA ligase beta chain